jgi:hypothetical protein
MLVMAKLLAVSAGEPKAENFASGANLTGKFTIFGHDNPMTNNLTHFTRRFQRNSVAINVLVSGVLETRQGQICDLSENGAQIMGVSLPERSRCEVMYREQVVYGIVMWSEIDRIGVRFPYELVAGPLHDELESARGITQPLPPPRLFQGLHATSFGKRGLS